MSQPVPPTAGIEVGESEAPRYTSRLNEPIRANRGFRFFGREFDQPGLRVSHEQSGFSPENIRVAARSDKNRWLG